MVKKEVLEAIALLTGTIVGAGVLGIPFVIAKSGFLTGLLDIVLLGFAILLINLSIGEVILRTRSFHQLTGYADKYLGEKGKIALTISMVVGIYGALIAYIIGVGEALAVIFNSSNVLMFSLLFFVFVAVLVYLGLKSIAKSELFLSSLVVTLILVISYICIFSGKMDIMRLADFNLSKIFIPYGVILFAFIGAAAIPEMRGLLEHRKKDLKKAIIIGSLIPLFLYAIFAFAVVSVFGKNVTEVATVGLGLEFGHLVVVLANLFAVFAMTTSFLALGLALKQMYHYDYGLNRKLSWSLACGVPLILFFLGFKSFVNVIGITGIFAGGLEGILIVLMLWSAKQKSERVPEYSLKFSKVIGVFLILVFVLGVLNYLIGLF